MPILQIFITLWCFNHRLSRKSSFFTFKKTTKREKNDIYMQTMGKSPQGISESFQVSSLITGPET
jgi:hypothetical protein